MVWKGKGHVLGSDDYLILVTAGIFLEVLRKITVSPLYRTKLP